MPLPDPAASRAVLIGVDAYDGPTHLGLPSVAAGTAKLGRLLTDARWWGLPAENCRVLHNPEDAGVVEDAVHTAATEAVDTLLVYFAGHGSLADGGLGLLLSGCDGSLPSQTVRYDRLREILQNGRRARNQVVVLDCCFSGAAVTGAMGGAHTGTDAAADPKIPAVVDSAFVMTSCPMHRRSYAPPGEPYPAFTGALLDTLERGVPGAPDPLPLGRVFERVRHVLRDRRMPPPQRLAVNDEIALVRNHAGAPPPPPPPPSPPPPPPPRSRWARRGARMLATAAVMVTLAGSAPSSLRLAPPAPRPALDRLTDPCSLLSPVALGRFGETELDPAYGDFARCDVLVHRADGTDVDVMVGFDAGQPPGSRTDTVRGSVRVREEPAESGRCDRLLLPAGTGVTVAVSARPQDPQDGGPAPLCELADAAASRAATVLDTGRAHRRTAAFPAGSLFHQDACGLLTAEALTAVPGADAAGPDPGFARWSCGWRGATTGLAVTVRFDRGGPLRATHGTFTRLAGRRALVGPDGPDEDAWQVKVVQRAYRDDRGRRLVETLDVVVGGEAGRETLRRAATSLAAAAAARLPAAVD